MQRGPPPYWSTARLSFPTSPVTGNLPPDGGGLGQRHHDWYTGSIYAKYVRTGSPAASVSRSFTLAFGGDRDAAWSAPADARVAPPPGVP